jgi:hypothetical protein
MQRPFASLTVVGVFITLLCITGCAARSHPILSAVARIPVSEHGYTPPTTATMLGPLRALEARLAELNVDVRTIPVAQFGTAMGTTDLTDPKRPVVRLPDNLSVDARFEALSHEAAHTLQPIGLSRSDYEVLAELVAWELARHYGRDTTYTTARYLANWKDSLAIIPALKADVQQIVAILLNQKGWYWWK